MLRRFLDYLTELFFSSELRNTARLLHSVNGDNFQLTVIDGEPSLVHTDTRFGVAITQNAWIMTVDGVSRLVGEPCSFTPTEFKLLKQAFLTHLPKGVSCAQLNDHATSLG